MKKQVEIALCVSTAVIALVVLFNLLPSGIRTTATLCAGFGAAAGAAASATNTTVMTDRIASINRNFLFAMPGPFQSGEPYSIGAFPKPSSR